MSDNNTAVIIAGGQNYSAWSSVMVRREFGNGIPVFEFSPVEGAYGSLYQNFALDVDDTVTIMLAGQLALTGVVTTRSAAMDKSSHTISIAGRSTTGLAADSTVQIKKGTYNGYTLEQAANAVLKPLGINFMLQNGGDAASQPFTKLMPKFGEYVHEFVSRMCMMKGVFVSGDEQGNLVASKHSTDTNTSATFAIGTNIISIHGTMDKQGAAGAYTGVSQTPGNDKNWPPRAFSASLQQPAGNAQVVSTFISEMPATSQELVARVEHEAAVSAWTVFTCTIEVNGWLDPSGKLWDPLSGMRVSVYAPGIFPKPPYMVECGITAVTFKQDSQSGSTTVLDLTLPSLLTGSATAGASVGPQSSPSEFSNVSDPTASPDPSDLSTST